MPLHHPETPEAISLTENILRVYSALSKFENLKPRDSVNTLFVELVQLTSYFDDTLTAQVLENKNIQQITYPLRLLSSLGEYELEKHWAIKLTTNKNFNPKLQHFPYYRNYEELIRLEYATLSEVSRMKFHKVLFVGSGPLPLSSILLATEYGLKIDALDRNEEAVRLSEKVVRNFKSTLGIQIIHADIPSLANIQEYDLIYVAALAGVNKNEKEVIFNHLFHSISKGTFLVVRTANGLRTLLYPQVPLEVLAGFNLKVIIHPLNHLVNSFIIIQKT